MAGLLFHILRMSSSQRLKKCHYCHDLLIGGMEHLLFFHILRRIVSTDFHIFQRGRYTTNQISIPLVRKKSSLPRYQRDYLFLMTICGFFMFNHQNHVAFHGFSDGFLGLHPAEVEVLGGLRPILSSSNDCCRG